jgi:ketosteroid isomerase-like protein
MCKALLCAASVLLVASLACASEEAEVPDYRQQVMDTEAAFARTMAERNFEAFTAFLSEEAIFFAGDKALRGKQTVADAWSAYYEGEDAPFSWEPRTVEVLPSGELALSTGPVRGRDGKHIANFTSIWRQEEPGVWRIIFDKGNPVCADSAAGE